MQEPTPEEQRTIGTPVEPGLVGHWKLDGGDDDIATDSSGLGNDADLYGQWVKGDFGTCLLMDGTPGALTVEDGPHLHFGTSGFTIAFWAKPDRFDTRLMGKERFPQTWWVINLLPDGRVELVLGETHTEGKMVRPTSEASLPKDRWTHLAFSVDREGSEVRCYVDGALDSTTAIPETLNGSLSVEGVDLMTPSAHKPFVGLFDELMIYQRALTDAEVKADYDSERPNRSSVGYE